MVWITPYTRLKIYKLYFIRVLEVTGIYRVQDCFLFYVSSTTLYPGTYWVGNLVVDVV